MKSAALRALESQVESALAGRIHAPFAIARRTAPDRLPTRVAALDALTGGLPRGALSEIVGPLSSGRSSLMLATLSAATAQGEACALVDAGDAFDPRTAAAAGVDLKRLLWVRCGNRASHAEFHASRMGPRETRNQKRETLDRLEQALKATDLLLNAGGFGVVAIDLADVPALVARRVPLTSWFRFRRAVENTPTVLLLLEQEPSARNCAAMVVKLESQQAKFTPERSAETIPAHTRVLRGLELKVEILQSRVERKPPCSAMTFATRAVWAG